jgi:hypothetical protein
MRSIIAKLMPASRHQDHTTWPSASRAFVFSHLTRPPPPAPNVRDDRETPLFIGHGMKQILPVIWEGNQPPPLRPINTTGKSGARAGIVSSEGQLLGPATMSRTRCGAISAFTRVYTRHGAAPQSRDPFEDDEPNARMMDPGSAAHHAAFAAYCAASGECGRRWLWVPACAGTTANEAAITSIELDTPAPRFVNPGSGLTTTAGRIAQRESVPFTRERSKVRSLVRPPYFALRAPRGAASLKKPQIGAFRF